jgi:hypothetical protein
MRGFAMRQSDLQLWRHGLFAWVRSSVWPGVVLILVALGLLWAFHQLARGTVQQSELRLQSISMYNKATWHCNALGNQTTRNNCLSQLQKPAYGTPQHASLKAPDAPQP